MFFDWLLYLKLRGGSFVRSKIYELIYVTQQKPDQEQEEESVLSACLEIAQVVAVEKVRFFWDSYLYYVPASFVFVF